MERKEQSYFVPITASIPATQTVSKELQEIIDILAAHDLFVDNFDTDRKQALAQIVEHYVAEYLASENYTVKATEMREAETYIRRCNAILRNLRQTVLSLEAQLKNTVKGKEELNTYLKIFLHRDDIQIDIADDKFLLKRGTTPANDLSEGEKTAIAFAYFLTELKSLKQENKLSNTIVYFDDPISSLDSNHVFQVRSLIQHFFKDKNDYLQLFISTHNFEFFSILSDSDLFKSTDSNNKNTRQYAIIRNGDASRIGNIPKQLKHYKSEYVHLFYVLKNFHELTNKEDFEHLIMLPNVLRRFLELYTLMKYPIKGAEIDKRIAKIFSPDESLYHNTKLYHWFSHQNQFEKVAQHDAGLSLIGDAVSEIMTHIEANDKLHWEGLTSHNA